MQTSTTEEARLGMHGRILRCPLGGNPEDCPLHEVRQRSLEDRLTWLESKTDKEVLELYTYHINCLERKLARQTPSPAPRARRMAKAVRSGSVDNK